MNGLEFRGKIAQCFEAHFHCPHMAVLCHFVNLPARDFPPFHKLFLSTPLQSQKFYHHSHHPQLCLRIAASRDGRKAKRDENIGNEIRKFLSSIGLPENHVPSMKELSQNGRQDLANIVRRRGYKYIRQLLEELNTKNMDTGHKGNSEELGGSVGQGENVVVLPDDVSSIQEAGYNHSVGTDKGVTINDQSSFAAESTTFSLQEKVAKFIECGELDTIEDCGLLIGHANEAEWNTKSSHSSNDPQGKDISVSVSSGNETLYENGPLSLQRIEHLPFESNSSRNDHLWPKEPTNIDNDLGTEKSENQAEIDHLKFLLHQKEMELNELKQQIEKEKLSLSVLQTEAETNMRNAQKLLSEKDSELEEVEGCLSLLQEVEILYSGEGENVEFSGSFNGWHNTITMHLQTPTESSASKLWRAVLWLYPGVYEIKFIVDGEWRIDPQRESITRGSIQNNILRVDEGLNTPVM